MTMIDIENMNLREAEQAAYVPILVSIRAHR